MSHSTRPTLSWKRLCIQSALAAYAYVFMEWLFFATKPSFMDALPLGQKLEILLLTGLVVAILGLAVTAVFGLLGLVPGPQKRRQVFLYAGLLVPALIAAALSLLLIDNFTYTVFHFGIVSAHAAWRGAYALLALLLLAACYRGALRGQGSGPRAGRRVQAWLAAGLLVVSLGLAGVRLATAASGDEIDARLQRQPHILLIGGEGVVAERMSVYGYRRETTPRLGALAETGLLAENNFANAAHTTGSVFAMLTGKAPVETRLLYSPNILEGADAYEHLPGILQRAGYTSAQITFPYYVDAYAVNMQEGFDEVNGHAIGRGEFARLARRLNLEDAGYFLPRLSERIFDRLLHVFYVRPMPDPYGEVLQAVDPDTVPHMSDQERIDTLARLLAEADGPLFVHVHLMGTHGPKFSPRRQVFSAGEEQNREWMTDFYDDAVLDFDAYIGEVVDVLERRGLMDETVLVVYSDHADRWRTDDRIPLLFHFPNGEHAGTVSSNTQLLDVAPTLLDYLGMEVPAWMDGQSLLGAEPDPLRPILSASVVGVDCNRPGWWCILDPRRVREPFYQFGSLQVVVCQRMYTLDLNHNRWTEVDVAGHTAPCPLTELPTRAEVRQIVLDHLRENGFDVSSLLP